MIPSIYDLIFLALIGLFVAVYLIKKRRASPLLSITLPLTLVVFQISGAIATYLISRAAFSVGVSVIAGAFVGLLHIPNPDKRVSLALGAAVGGFGALALTWGAPPILAELWGMGWGVTAAVQFLHRLIGQPDGTGVPVPTAAAPAAAPAGAGITPSRAATHGSAAWGTGATAARFGHHKPGMVLGRLEGQPFRFSGHVLTCAPTGSGKGIGAVIPNLLEYPGSTLVMDIKGENYAVTARYRREVLGHRVYVIDPFRVTGPQSDACNWLDRIDPTSPDCVGESAALADCLVIPSDDDGASHFDETAKGLLQGLMLYVAGLPDPDRRTLGEVRALLTGPDLETLLHDLTQDQGYAYGIPARAARTLLDTGDRERGSILSTARRSTAFLDDPRVAECLSRSDFRLSDLKADRVTVYVVIPPAKLNANARLLRGFIGSALAALTKDTATPEYKVLFMLDEFAQLGRMTMIEDAISLVRGYGVAFWIFVQDISQLKGTYKKWQTFTANTAKVFFGTADIDTAKYISESLGKLTITYETEGGSRGFSTGGFNTGSSSSEQVTGRDLLTPDEVIRLGPARPITIIGGEPPYLLERLNYLTDPSYAGRADLNPYHA